MVFKNIRQGWPGELKILKSVFYSRDTLVVAEELIGKILVRKTGHNVLAGAIIETEAYYGQGDPASHAFRGKTPRASIMFGRAGIAYVYFCYGMYWLLNAVTEIVDVPGAVLIRSVMPLSGVEQMCENRKTDDIKNLANLANGPGKLTQAFGIDTKDNGKDLTDPDSGINICYFKQAAGYLPHLKISRTSRVGVSAGKEKLFRFFLENPGVIQDFYL
ncbi:MAG: DNA-3-methyladenine glycosylase [Actinobacteria bacterium]|nr:DNA-3-methyladenine glycosylase [Actinomycetota bacterium]